MLVLAVSESIAVQYTDSATSSSALHERSVTRQRG